MRPNDSQRKRGSMVKLRGITWPAQMNPLTERGRLEKRRYILMVQESPMLVTPKREGCMGKSMCLFGSDQMVMRAGLHKCSNVLSQLRHSPLPPPHRSIAFFHYADNKSSFPAILNQEDSQQKNSHF